MKKVAFLVLILSFFGSRNVYSQQAIARWDVVPFQEFNGDFNIGVVAFHKNGINKVEFSYNTLGGAKTDTVTTMSLNTQINVWEYYTTLHAQDFADGLIKIVATAYPNAGTKKILDTLFLNTNYNGSLSQPKTYVSPGGNDLSGDGSAANPYRTLSKAALSIQSAYGSAEGGTIYLFPGIYDTITTSATIKNGYRWLTISAAPGYDTSDVWLHPVSVAGFSNLNIKFSKLKIMRDTGSAVLGGTVSLVRHVWLDSTKLTYAQGRYAPKSHSFFYNTAKLLAYYTNTHVYDCADGPVSSFYCRNVFVEKIKSDAFSNSAMIVNCSVDSIDAGTSGAHPDVYQIYSPTEKVDNRILYGLKATNCESQGLFCGAIAANDSISNIAIINVLIEGIPGSNYATQWWAPSNHIIIKHLTMANQSFYWNNQKLKDIVVEHSAFRSMTHNVGVISADTLYKKITFFNNNYHYNTGYGVISPGTDSTFGDPGFIDPLADNYEPSDTSILNNRTTVSDIPGDISGNIRCNKSSIGAYRWLNEFPSVVSGPNTTICHGTTVQLTSSVNNPGVSYSWSPAAGLNNITIDNPIASPSVTTNYIVTVTRGACENSYMTMITVDTMPAIPIITPNGGSLNSNYSNNVQWYLNGNIISGATSSSYTPTQNGNYTVRYNTNCDTVFSAPYVVSGLSIAEQKSQTGIELYPNPTSGESMVVLLRNTNVEKIEVIDIHGKIILTIEKAKITSPQLEIQLPDLNPGIFFLRAVSETKSVDTKKFVVF